MPDIPLLFIPNKAQAQGPYSTNWRTIEEWAKNFQINSGSRPIFHMPGVVAIGESDSWIIPGAWTRAVARLTNVGSTSTDIDILQNGTTAGTLTIASGDATGDVNVITYVNDPLVDYIQVSVTAAGTAAEGLVLVLL